MVRLKHGFKLFQPWASHVVQGKLNLLVRTFNSKNRERVAVIASNNIDKIWLRNTTTAERINIFDKRGIIGSVRIKDCIEINISDIESELMKLGGKEYLDYYPKYLIPTYTRKHNVYIWIIDNTNEWKKPRLVFSKAITWVKLNLDDE